MQYSTKPQMKEFTQIATKENAKNILTKCRTKKTLKFATNGKVFKKTLDKSSKLCYNNYSERKSSRGYLFKSPTPLAVDHSALSQRVVKPPDLRERGKAKSRANKSGKQTWVCSSVGRTQNF